MLQLARRRLRQLRRAWHSEIRAIASRGSVRPRTVLYESFAGNGALCNPEAIFRELLRAPDMADLRHIWVLDDPKRHHDIRREFAGDPRVRFVKYRSAAYFRAIATSGYLINNATFPHEFGKRAGQTYLNTWHGTPLKLMGYDMPNGAIEAANTLRNFVSADFLLSQNEFMTRQMYEQAYRLRGAFRGLILEEGYPRVDRQVIDQNEFLDGRALLEAAGIELGGRNIVLFAPTWKGDSFSSPDDDAMQLIESARQLQSLLGSEQYVVLLKTHQAVHQLAAARPEFRSLLVPNDIPTNVVLGLTSTLVTDYSSIFFDYLQSERPIVFFTPDVAEYSASRGTYFPPEELPGPVCVEVAQVAASIRAQAAEGADSPWATTRRDWRERFLPRDDGSSASRVVDAVFRGVLDPQRALSVTSDTRVPVLLHLGGMRSNGITTSALNLLSSIDHDRFDVSIVIGKPWSAQQRANQGLIDPRIRQFHRAGGMNGSKVAHLLRRLSQASARPEDHRALASQARLWDAEWKRCFGDLRFGAVADFSGYSPFWATLLLHSPGSTRSIWMHNDMASEEHRLIRGRKRMRRSLRAVFALYSQFDRLVSVSDSLSAVNRSALAESYHLDPAAFVSARNLVNESRVLTGIGANLADLAGHPLDEETQLPLVPGWVDDLATHEQKNWFVTVGRFSTEKNQARLLRAFAKVHELRPDSRLLIVGYGPLRSTLERTAENLGLAESAFVVGPYANPFPIMAAADCFVLSSDYEGQPMVLLEAAITGLPIVSVDFGSIEDALPEGEMRVVDQTDDALAEGMLAFLDGQVGPAHLDVAVYNAAALREFDDALIGVRRPGNTRRA
ncbi:MAG: glycosyltransferase [Microbacteriaceae bacterium]|nr:glycosyltransferase [Microbacteriaceae bacterium]